METIHAGDTPLAAFLEGRGYLDSTLLHNSSAFEEVKNFDDHYSPSFAPSSSPLKPLRTSRKRLLLSTINSPRQAYSTIGRIHNAWSTAVNSRLGRTENARFIEHFRYLLVCSQLLNEYIDQGATSQASQDVAALSLEHEDIYNVTNVYGAAATASAAFASVYVVHWARTGRSGIFSKSRATFAISVCLFVMALGYAYFRRQWLKLLRRQAVTAAMTLTTNWQTFEMSTGSALIFIQEVELVSKGYRLSTPLPPASRIEENTTQRRCGRLRRILARAFTSAVPACIEACNRLRTLIDEDDLEKYYEVYDINIADVKEASDPETLKLLDEDLESLKSLRVLSYREGILRRVVLCSLMALEADGGKPDIQRWRMAIDVMHTLNTTIAPSADKVQQVLREMETMASPMSPTRPSTTPARDKTRASVRKISMLSSGIKTLQAKMQILREETNRSIEQSDDLSSAGPTLMAQYESIGSDLKELIEAWEIGKTVLQDNIIKQEQRISQASSGFRSTASSLGGITAVDDLGTPDDALKALNGEMITPRSNRSSLAIASSEDEVFEAIAMPKQRSSLTREERIARMYEDRERQATIRAKRDTNTNMLRELESVINLRPRKSVTGTSDEDFRVATL